MIRRAVLASLCLHGLIFAALAYGRGAVFQAQSTPETGVRVALVPVWVAGANRRTRKPVQSAHSERMVPAGASSAARPAPDRLAGSRSNATVTAGAVVAPRLDPHHRNEPPIYPVEAVRAGEEGTVLLRVQVAADGRAVRVRVVRGSGVPCLDAAAREAVAAWHFLPGRRAGHKVPAEMPIRVRFRLK